MLAMRMRKSRPLARKMRAVRRKMKNQKKRKEALHVVGVVEGEGVGGEEEGGDDRFSISPFHHTELLSRKKVILNVKPSAYVPVAFLSGRPRSLSDVRCFLKQPKLFLLPSRSFLSTTRMSPSSCCSLVLASFVVRLSSSV